MFGLYNDNALNGPLKGRRVSGSYCGVEFSGVVFAHEVSGVGIDFDEPIAIHDGKSSRRGCFVLAEDMSALSFK